MKALFSFLLALILFLLVCNVLPLHSTAAPKKIKTKIKTTTTTTTAKSTTSDIIVIDEGSRVEDLDEQAMSNEGVMDENTNESGGDGSSLSEEFTLSVHDMYSLPGYEGPIDVVIAWMNASDASLLTPSEVKDFDRAKKIYSRQGREFQSLFATRDEIMLNLLTLQFYGHSWIRTVFLVSPHTLDISFLSSNFSNRIKFVLLDEIIPSQFLPTFNSFVIETYIYRIKGLSEIYIYFRDHIFLMQEMDAKRVFYSNYYLDQLQQQQLQQPLQSNEADNQQISEGILVLPYEQSNYICKEDFHETIEFKTPSLFVTQNTARLFYKTFNKCYSWWSFGLAPFVQNKTVNKITFATFKAALTKTSRNKVRREVRNFQKAFSGDVNFLVLSNYVGVLNGNMKFSAQFVSEYIHSNFSSKSKDLGGEGLSHFGAFDKVNKYEPNEQILLCHELVANTVKLSIASNNNMIINTAIDEDTLKYKVCDAHHTLQSNKRAKYPTSIDIVVTFTGRMNNASAVDIGAKLDRSENNKLNMALDFLNMNLYLISSFAPWVRNVIIIHPKEYENAISRQISDSNFKTEYSKKFRFVSCNTDILSNPYLIQHFLFQIAELSEIYIYLGYDKLLLRPLDIDDFIRPNGYIAIPARRFTISKPNQLCAYTAIKTDVVCCTNNIFDGSSSSSSISNNTFESVSTSSESKVYSDREKYDISKSGLDKFAFDSEVNRGIQVFKAFSLRFDAFNGSSFMNQLSSDFSCDNMPSFYNTIHVQNKTLNSLVMKIFEDIFTSEDHSSSSRGYNFDLFMMSNFAGMQLGIVELNYQYFSFDKKYLMNFEFQDSPSTSELGDSASIIRESLDGVKRNEYDFLSLEGIKSSKYTFLFTICDVLVDFIEDKSSDASALSKHSFCPKSRKYELSCTALSKPIDIVIPWTNTSDPTWQKGLFSVHRHFNTINSQITNEIQLCLLSLQSYAPWARRVIIYSEHSFSNRFLMPSFREKIRFVKPSSFIKSVKMPSFSALVIESFIYKIPDLSELYFVLDSKVAANSLIKLSSFVSHDNSVLLIPAERQDFRCDKRYKADSTTKAIALNTFALFQTKFNSPCSTWYPHAPYLQNKTINKIAAKLFESEIKQLYKTGYHVDVITKEVARIWKVFDFVALSSFVSVRLGSFKFTDSIVLEWTSSYANLNKALTQPYINFVGLSNLRSYSYAESYDVYNAISSKTCSTFSYTNSVVKTVAQPASEIGAVSKACKKRAAPVAIKDLSRESKYNGPIDIVITWLDSTNKKWQIVYNKYAILHNQTRYEKERFVSANEIELNLISLQATAPWVRYVFIFSLHTFSLSFLSNSFAKKIKFVSQASVIPKNLMPIFNSNAIEAYIHKIPGLSEIYVYINDDMYFVKPFNISKMILGQGYISIPSMNIDARCHSMYVNHRDFSNKHNFVYTNTVKLFQKKYFKCLPWFAYNHEPYFQNKTINALTASIYKDEVDFLMDNRFRNNAPLDHNGDFNFMYLSNYVGVEMRVMEFSNKHKSRYESYGNSLKTTWTSASKGQSNLDFVVMQELFKARISIQRDVCDIILDMACSSKEMAGQKDCWRGKSICARLKS